MRRFHLSNDPALAVEWAYDNEGEKATRGVGRLKPDGFWYDIDLDWLRWLDGEGYIDDAPPDGDIWMRPYLYEVTVDLSDVRVIRGGAALDQFHQQFWRAAYPIGCLDFDRLSREYAGLEIAPYIWSHRLHHNADMLWYYSWDCASGVIWRQEALRQVTLVAEGCAAVISFYRQFKGSK